jgi:hypothetical protein
MSYKVLRHCRLRGAGQSDIMQVRSLSDTCPQCV